MSEEKYTTNVGDYLIIWITGDSRKYIAEVTRGGPRKWDLRMKVEESGPYAYLKGGDFIIHEDETAQFQKDHREETDVFLKTEKQTGRKVFSGLKSLGVKDGKLREILPG